jgi:protein CpxP
MNKTRTFKTLLIGAALAISIPTMLYARSSDDDTACHRHGDKSHTKMDFSAEKHHGMPPFIKGLNLTTTQKTQIDALFAQQKPQIEAQMKQRHALMKDMLNLTNNETLDEKQAEQVASQLASLEKETVLNRTKMGNKVYAILTPEQRKQMSENMKKHMERMDKATTDSDPKQPANFRHHHQKHDFLFRS